MSIKIDDLVDAVSGALNDYSSEVTEAVKDSVKQVAKETLQEVKQNSPVRFGNYKKSWGQATIANTPSRIVISVHNRKHYRLTHLLENGHAKVNGGRTRSFPHIAPAERFAERKLQQEVEVKVKG